MTAIGAYHDFVLNEPTAGIDEIVHQLGRRARSEDHSLGQVTAADFEMLVGVIDEREPAVLQKVRREARVSGLLRRTEVAYVGRIKRFLTSHGESLVSLDDESGDGLPAEAEIQKTVATNRDC